MRALERYLMLQIIDQRWREHLYDMDYLREGIHLRGFAQIEPLVAYKNEAFTLFAGPDELDLGRLRADDLQRRGRGRRAPTATARAAGPPPEWAPPPQQRAARRARVLAAAPRRTSRAPTASRRRASPGEEPAGRRSSAASTSTSRSAATTRAGAARARSSRSATAPERRLRTAGLTHRVGARARPAARAA